MGPGPGLGLWLDEREMRAWRLMVGVTNELMAALDHELVEAHGLALADYEVFVFLSEAPEHRLRMSDLADRLHLSPSGLTRRLDRLVRSGLVVREQCPSDRRGSFAVLTPAGLARLVDAAPTHVAGVRRHFVDRLTPAQLDALGEALAAISRERDPSLTR